MNKPEMVKILKVRRENSRVKTIVLNKRMNAIPGQFAMLWIPEVGEKPFSFSSIHGNLEITVKSVGKFTEKLCSMKKGDLIGIRGPYGNGFRIKGKKPCIIGGGVGIAPLMPIIREYGDKATVIHCARTRKELLFVKRIRKAGADLLTETGDYSHGRFSIIKRGRFDQIYCCGPELMMKKILDISLKKRIPCQLSLERYMKCGIGLCGSCTIDPSGLRVCTDGPVFNAKELKDSEFGRYKRDATGSKVNL